MDYMEVCILRFHGLVSFCILGVCKWHKIRALFSGSCIGITALISADVFVLLED